MNTRRRRRYIYRLSIFVGVVLALVVVPLLAQADGVLTTRWPPTPAGGEGRYDMVVNGVGMEGFDTGSFSINVPGDPVIAFLYWAGLDDPGGPGDDTVDVTVNLLPTETRTADDTFGPDIWDSNRLHYVYVEDVTSLIETGINDITIDNFGPLFRNYGSGIIVVYEDPTLPLVRIEIKDGLDSLFAGFAPPQGPNGEVNCFQFDAAPIDRLMEFSIFAGGVSTTSGDRPTALWAQTGVANNPGALPTNLVEQPDAFELFHDTDSFPFDSHNGPQWDVLMSEDTQLNGVPVPAGDNYVCLQAESDDDQTDPLGNPLTAASLVWISLAGKIPLPAAPLAAIGDLVWLDENQNGIQDAAEPGISGVTVNLYNGAGTQVSSTTTNANGRYLFDNLNPGDYFVEFVPPAGYQRSPQDQGINDGADSDADLTSGRTVVTTLAAGERDLTWDAGIFQTQIITDTPTPTLTPTGTITITPTVTPTGTITPDTAVPTTPADPALALDPVCLFRGNLAGVPGEVAVWRLTASNPGTAPMPDVVVTDESSAASVSEIVTATTTKGSYTITGLTVIFNLGTLAPGESVEMTITVRFREDLTTPIGNRAVARSNPRLDVNCVSALPSTGYPPSTLAPQSSPARMPLIVGGVVMAVGGLVIWRRRRVR